MHSDPEKMELVNDERFNAEEQRDRSQYSRKEIQRNRRWNVGLASLCLAAIWSAHFFAGMQLNSALTLTAVVLFVALLYRRLFASSASVKLDENTPGMGNKIHPRTMGGIIGFLNDGFKQ